MSNNFFIIQLYCFYLCLIVSTFDLFFIEFPSMRCSAYLFSPEFEDDSLRNKNCKTFSIIISCFREDSWVEINASWCISIDFKL